jgi:hypothetical protein
VEFLIPVVAVVGVLALIGGIIAVNSRMEQKRTEALAAASQTMGFAFEPDGDLEVLKGFGDLPLYGRGHSMKVMNVMTGQAGDRDVKLFDYRYTTGSGKNSHTWSQTVALFPKAGQGLPDLLLAPENVFHKIGAAFGYQDIDFDTSPDFSSHYLLRGPDEMAIRAAFSAAAQTASNPVCPVELLRPAAGVARRGRRRERRPLPLRQALQAGGPPDLQGRDAVGPAGPRARVTVAALVLFATALVAIVGGVVWLGRKEA